MSEGATWKNPTNHHIQKILQIGKNIAVVGCSPKPDRTSYQITDFLISKGYNVFPVHPKADIILGRKVYPNLTAIPEPIDIVNVFRKPEFTPAIAKEAVSIHAKTLWLQLAIINEETWNIATNNQLNCIMDRCIAVMHRLLIRDEKERL
ncbi:MAG: CoA-binding protein [Ghiorsea sp.]